MARSHGRRAGWVAVAIGTAVAVIGAGVFVAGSRRGSEPRVVPPAAGPTVAEAVERLASAAPGDVESAWQDLAATISREAEGAGDPEAVYAQVEATLDRVLADEAGRAAVFAADGALDGTILDPPATAAEDAKGDALDGHAVELVSSVRHRPLSVIFVNGILNTSVSAAASRDRLSRIFGVPVSLAYNRSAVEPYDYTVDGCSRAIDRLFASHPEDATAPGSWAQLLRDAASLAAEVPLSTLCEGVDEALTALGAGAAALNTVADAVSGMHELYRQRLYNTDADSADVNGALVARIEREILRGNRVLLVGHSQGTLFVRNALRQVDAWWRQQIRDGDVPLNCPDRNGMPVERDTTVPVAALHVSPAFGTTVAGPGNDTSGRATDGRDLSTGRQRYVMLRGDVLNLGRDSLGVAVGSVPATAEPTAGQALRDADEQPWYVQAIGSVTTHALATYLEPGTTSRRQVEDGFAQLREYLDGLPALDEDCSAQQDRYPDGQPWVVWEEAPTTPGFANPSTGITVGTVGDYRTRPEGTGERHLLVDGQFASEAEATAAACSQLTDIRPRFLGAGMYGYLKSDGELHRVVNFSCPDPGS